ncbi:unnamed protein product, partial [Brassica rapa]
ANKPLRQRQKGKSINTSVCNVLFKNNNKIQTGLFALATNLFVQSILFNLSILIVWGCWLPICLPTNTKSCLL